MPTQLPDSQPANWSACCVVVGVMGMVRCSGSRLGDAMPATAPPIPLPMSTTPKMSSSTAMTVALFSPSHTLA